MDIDKKEFAPHLLRENKKSIQLASFQKGAGFTLIELLVVISIIGFLASMAIFAFNNARMKARDTKRLADIRQVQYALELYFDNNGEYPEIDKARSFKDNGNGTLWLSGAGSLGNALSPYMPNLILDPLNNSLSREYIYDSEGGYGYGLACSLEDIGYDNIEQNDNGQSNLMYEVGPDVGDGIWWN